MEIIFPEAQKSEQRVRKRLKAKRLNVGRLEGLKVRESEEEVWPFARMTRAGFANNMQEHTTKVTCLKAKYIERSKIGAEVLLGAVNDSGEKSVVFFSG